MPSITERIRRRIVRWLLTDVDPRFVSRALKTINGGATKHGTVSIDTSNITLPGTVDGVDVGSHDHSAGAGMGPAVKRLHFFAQGTEPAIPADEVAIWHDTATDRWHFIQGTDGTVAGNKRVELS